MCRPQSGEQAGVLPAKGGVLASWRAGVNLSCPLGDQAGDSRREAGRDSPSLQLLSPGCLAAPRWVCLQPGDKTSCFSRKGLFYRGLEGPRESWRRLSLSESETHGRHPPFSSPPLDPRDLDGAKHQILRNTEIASSAPASAPHGPDGDGLRGGAARAPTPRFPSRHIKGLFPFPFSPCTPSGSPQGNGMWTPEKVSIPGPQAED